MWLTKPRLFITGVLLILVLSACSGTQKQEKDQVVVFAASSLTDVLTQMEVDFEKKHPDLDVKLNFAGSKTLRSQIENGAQPNLFLSANEGHYKALEDQGMFEVGSAFAKNEMVIIMQKDGPVQIHDLKDLSLDLKLVLAEPAVPAGDYARSIIASYDKVNGNDFEKKVLSKVVSEESSVRQVLMKVALGEADAGIVYRTDVTESVADKLNFIEIPSDHNVVASYYMGMLKSGEGQGAKALYDYVKSQEAKTILAQHGFVTE